MLDRAVFLSPTPFLEVTAQGFTMRRMILRSDELTISLWPTSSPTGLDEDFSATIAYSASSCPAANTGLAALTRAPSVVNTVNVFFRAGSPDSAVEAAHQQAIASLNEATGGAPRYQLTADPTGEVSFAMEIDPNHARCTGPQPVGAFAELNGVNGRISGGRILYCSVAGARSVTLVQHELGHTWGLYHSPSPADMMYCSSSGRAAQFSSRERLVMKLMRQRRAGNRWPDDDRQALTPLVEPRGTTQIIACN